MPNEVPSDAPSDAPIGSVPSIGPSSEPSCQPSSAIVSRFTKPLEGGLYKNVTDAISRLETAEAMLAGFEVKGAQEIVEFVGKSFEFDTEERCALQFHPRGEKDHKKLEKMLRQLSSSLEEIRDLSV
mmetsp:Transcript_26457/g.61911  ORF Transcript_26457/g.61911 Transcript_26457/m.61911 type:complete len:127 (-) Transcript_26457:43-423(-)